MLTFAKSYVDGLGLNLDAEVAAFRAALVAHRGTINKPAPVALPIVEAIVAAGGYIVHDDTTPAPEAAPNLPPSLLQLKAELKVEVDTAAEAARLKYITPGSGQALEYQATIEEARRLAGDPAPAVSAYPNLRASVGIDRHPSTGLIAATIQDVAAAVLAMQAQWVTVGAMIRGKRLAAKAAIDAATDEAGARAAAVVSWP